MRCTDYAEANNLAKQTSGKGLSILAFAIAPKIREVDDLLHSGILAGQIKIIREVHPEVCFCGLNGLIPMRYSKKKPEGFT